VTAAANLAPPGTFPALPVQSVSASSANPSDVIDLGVGCARI
jgi:hypothetical protein